MADANLKSCVLCDKSGARACSKCHSINYCSKACQLSDWNIHKQLCSTFATFDNSSRPSDQHTRAILFPVEDTKPQLVWVPWKWEDDDGIKWHCTDTSSFLKLDKKHPCQSRSVVHYNPILQRALDDQIIITYRDEFLYDGSKVNMSIANASCGKSSKDLHWRGPVIAYGKKGQSDIFCRDLGMEDFRHIIDFLRSY
ncbi:hypothetical protein QAD02_016331 [Eretmocerus hayati]|uniref:Uncharacterized protein n=1 Tax=Eretmocerus hayati TaxID=131215 RepID=A0ACC2PAA0_9HYME|nr:hypothetical protein QAD02_016331 [Eretmocerus hayati]